MQKNKLLVILIFAVLLFIPKFAFGHDIDTGDSVDKIDMTIDLKQSGSAIITEKWTVRSSGRHGYTKLFRGVNVNEIVNFNVSDEKNSSYEYVTNNNISIDSENIKDKYGVVPDQNGATLFWGVLEDGNHEYTLKYQVNNFMKEFKSIGVAKGFRFFFADENYIANTRLTIKADNYQFNENNASLQNFDMENTTINYNEDGSIVMEFSTYYFNGEEFIKFADDAPFAVTYYKPDNKLKKQDYLVLTILIIISIAYLIVDIYRTIYEYQSKKRKILELQRG